MNPDRLADQFHEGQDLRMIVVIMKYPLVNMQNLTVVLFSHSVDLLMKDQTCCYCSFSSLIFFPIGLDACKTNPMWHLPQKHTK